jgi:hypothetical protein
MLSPSLRMARWRGLAALIAMLMVAAGIGQTSFGHRILRQAGLLEQPTTYTSLSFLHPQSLPEQLKSKRAIVHIAFVIHNASSTVHDYQWSLILVQAGRARRVVASSTRVAPGLGTPNSRSVPILCTKGQVRIEVNLARPAEYIDIWTKCWSRRS